MIDRWFGNWNVEDLRRGRRNASGRGVKILGVGQAPSRGVRKGEIVDLKRR